MSIERYFDTGLIAALALREKQIQQNYRPIIAVHKWFARRPGALFRGLILAEFGGRPLAESYFTANDFPGRTVADPFMGGGTPLLEANRVGCDVLGFDINPMATWIVREEIEHLDSGAYRLAADDLISELESRIGDLYRTDCPTYGDHDVPVKYFLWIKTIDCAECGANIDLFPGYLIADDTRHKLNVLVCAHCGELNEVASLMEPGLCRACGERLVLEGPAKRGRCSCRQCGHINKFPDLASGSPRHRLFAIEYFNRRRKASHSGRFFKKPDSRDLERVAAAGRAWHSTTPVYTPTQAILPGDETDRLHRWGYRNYRDLFSDRQLLGLELSCWLISTQENERVRHALATNLSDLLRYQNMLCRYDTMALKSLDIFSVHGFPVGLVQCESNLIGIVNGNGTAVGSGGWINVIEKYAKAKRYCDEPFEVRHQQRRKIVVPIRGEWIGECRPHSRSRSVQIRCASSTGLQLAQGSLDAVFTDPPYFGNVQYGELMDFCYVWLRRLVGTDAEGFDRISTRSTDELTGNTTGARDIVHFTEGLSATFTAAANALKPDGPLVFTFHHNSIEAYLAVGVAILDSGLACTATFPCPAEMGGSIHIHGTGSSIVDTVFVCRTALLDIAAENVAVSALVTEIEAELDTLRRAGMRPTPGDIRCILYGHLMRLAVMQSRSAWNCEAGTSDRLKRFGEAVTRIGDPAGILSQLTDNAVRHSDPVDRPAEREEPMSALPL